MIQRPEKVSSLLRKEIAEYLRDERFEELTGFVTITGVDVSPDLEYAKVFFSSIGQAPEEVLKILKKYIYEIQGRLNHRLPMRRVPRITFVYDSSGEEAERIRKIMKGLQHGDSK